MFVFNGQPVRPLDWIVAQFDRVGLGFFPRWAIACVVISGVVVFFLPLLLLAIAAVLVIFLMIVVLALLLWIIRLPARILGLFAPTASQAPPDDAGRVNVRVIQRPLE